MGTISGSFSATGQASGIILVKPQDSVAYTLVVAEAEAFIGTVIFQKSTDGGQSWQNVTSYAGTAATPLEDTAADTSYQNLSTHPESVRFVCDLLDTGESSDNIAYTLADAENVFTNAAIVNGQVLSEDGTVLMQFNEASVEIGVPLTFSAGSVDSSGKWTLGATSSSQTHVINGRLDLVGPAGSDARIFNQSAATRNAVTYCSTAASETTSDAYSVWQQLSGEKWSAGMDTSDSLAFKMSNADGFASAVWLRCDATTNIPQFITGMRTIVAIDDVTDPPTDAELDTAFGAPATVGAGFVGILDDNNGGVDVWLVYTDGASWFYLQGTTAS